MIGTIRASRSVQLRHQHLYKPSSRTFSNSIHRETRWGFIGLGAMGELSSPPGFGQI